MIISIWHAGREVCQTANLDNLFIHTHGISIIGVHTHSPLNIVTIMCQQLPARVDMEYHNGNPDTLWLIDDACATGFPQPYRLMGENSVTLWSRPVTKG